MQNNSHVYLRPAHTHTDAPSLRLARGGHLRVHQRHDLLHTHLRVLPLQLVQDRVLLADLLHLVVGLMRLVKPAAAPRLALVHAELEAPAAEVVANFL